MSEQLTQENEAIPYVAGAYLASAALLGAAAGAANLAIQGAPSGMEMIAFDAGVAVLAATGLGYCIGRLRAISGGGEV